MRVLKNNQLILVDNVDICQITIILFHLFQNTPFSLLFLKISHGKSKILFLKGFSHHEERITDDVSRNGIEEDRFRCEVEGISNEGERICNRGSFPYFMGIRKRNNGSILRTIEGLLL